MWRAGTALAAAALLSGCGKSSLPGPAKDEPVHAAVTARTAVATVEPFTRTVDAIGTVVARPGHSASLSAPAPTRVARVLVMTGQRVVAGAPLVEFEQAGFVAAARSADAALSAAQRNADRAERLSRDGIIARKEYELAQTELAQARANAVTARRAEELSVLRSPVSGIVTRMGAVLGAPADPSQVLVEVADPSAFDVILSLAPSGAAAVHAGATVALADGENAESRALGRGVVSDVGAGVDSVSRTVAIRVRLTSPRRTLRLGETVFGRIAVDTRPNALTVPTDALVPDADGYKVFVVDGRGVAHARPVQVGGRNEGRVEVTGGLRAGEAVVSYGAFGVEDSATVNTGRGPAP